MEEKTMEAQAATSSYSSDVLHPEAHKPLSQEIIAKAVARHQREHPCGQKMTAVPNPQKTTPRR
jgi:hypothetical protein